MCFYKSAIFLGYERIVVSVSLKRNVVSVFAVTYLPTILMNIINQGSVYLRYYYYWKYKKQNYDRNVYSTENSLDLLLTMNITCMMVLSSVYLSGR